MKIEYLACPRCGGAIQLMNDSVQYCCYCGAPLHVDDGVRTTIIRDEVRLKEAENESRRLDLEMEKLKREKQTVSGVSIIGSILKALICVAGIVFITLFGLGYVVSPFDIMSGFLLDDIGMVVLCVYLISRIGKKMGK